MSAPVDFVTETFGDGSQWTRLDRLTDGRVMCCLCFDYAPKIGLEPTSDGSGDLTDVCRDCAARERPVPVKLARRTDATEARQAMLDRVVPDDGDTPRLDVAAFNSSI